MTAAAQAEHDCRLAGYSGSQPAVVTVTHYDRAGRWRRALTALAHWGAFALVSVFIPVAHFILVPGFLLYAVVTFAQRLGAAETVTRARGTCPDCGAEQDLDVLGRWRVPREVACRQCGRGLRLTEG